MLLDSPASIAGAVKDNGWYQGAILPSTAHNDIAKAIGQKLDEQSICIVITHSCDLVRPDPTMDVEIVVANLTGKTLVPDDEFTLCDERKLRRWERFDFISFEDPTHSRNVRA